MATDLLLAADPPGTGVTVASRAAGERSAGHLRRLRATAWTLSRLLRDPRRMPGTWCSPRFATRLDRVRIGLLPIRSLAALADSYAREHAPDDTAVRLAYGLRWLELSTGIDERPWRLHCSPPPR